MRTSKEWDRKSSGYNFVSIPHFIGIFQEERKKASHLAVQVDHVKDADCPLHQPHVELVGGKPLGRSQGHKGVSWPTANGNRSSTEGFPLIRTVGVCSSEKRESTD